MHAPQEDFEMSNLIEESESTAEFTEPESRLIDVRPSLGVAGRKSRLPIRDIANLAAQFICLAFATLAVFWPAFAIKLGQVNQLIVIGFLLAVMSLVFENLAKQAALICAGSSTKSTIQDFDAFMRKDLTASQVHWYVRTLLLVLIGIPLGLAAAYKTFTGGHTTRTIAPGDGSFGFTAAPGKQRIGNGLSLLSDLYVPFWIDPVMSRTYGFALYIVDNETAVIVDGPLPDYLTSLSSTLTGQQTISLTATVNATVSRMINPMDEERASSDYWEALDARFGKPHGRDALVAGAGSALWAGMNGFSNYSVMFLSNWNVTRNETFESEAIRTVLTRELATAEWLVTSNKITLTSATLLPDTVAENQDIIQNNLLTLQDMFGVYLGEFDWHNRAGAFDQPYPAGTLEKPLWYQPVNTVPALAAAMLWSRVVSLDGVDRPLTLWEGITGYEKAAEDITITQTYPTLKRSPFLMIVLLVLPLLSIACVALKMVYFGVPIGNNFNSVAMLAAANSHDLKLLRGAALTGALRHKVRVAFTVFKESEDDRLGAGNVVMMLDSGLLQRGTIESNVVYC